LCYRDITDVEKQLIFEGLNYYKSNFFINFKHRMAKKMKSPGVKLKALEATAISLIPHEASLQNKRCSEFTKPGSFYTNVTSL